MSRSYYIRREIWSLLLSLCSCNPCWAVLGQTWQCPVLPNISNKVSHWILCRPDRSWLLVRRQQSAPRAVLQVCHVEAVGWPTPISKTAPTAPDFRWITWTLCDLCHLFVSMTHCWLSRLYDSVSSWCGLLIDQKYICTRCCCYVGDRKFTKTVILSFSPRSECKVSHRFLISGCEFSCPDI